MNLNLRIYLSANSLYPKYNYTVSLIPVSEVIKFQTALYRTTKTLDGGLLKEYLVHELYSRVYKI